MITSNSWPVLVQPVDEVQVGVELVRAALAVVHRRTQVLGPHVHERPPVGRVADARAVAVPVVHAQQPVRERVDVLRLLGVVDLPAVDGRERPARLAREQVLVRVGEVAERGQQHSDPRGRRAGARPHDERDVVLVAPRLQVGGVHAARQVLRHRPREATRPSRRRRGRRRGSGSPRTAREPGASRPPCRPSRARSPRAWGAGRSPRASARRCR